MPFKFNLGDELKDKVTGFKGIAVMRTEHLTGCDTYALQPRSKTGNKDDMGHFDDNRLELVKAGAVVLDGVQEAKAQKERVGASGVPALRSGPEAR